MEKWFSWTLVRVEKPDCALLYGTFSIYYFLSFWKTLIWLLGCQYYGYSSDLTRCWPVNGRFSAAQRAAYEAVLDVQLDLIKFCQELPTLDDLFQRMCRQLGRNLSELGFGKSKNIMNGTCIERIQVYTPSPSWKIN